MWGNNPKQLEVNKTISSIGDLIMEMVRVSKKPDVDFSNHPPYTQNLIGLVYKPHSSRFNSEDVEAVHGKIRTLIQQMPKWRLLNLNDLWWNVWNDFHTSDITRDRFVAMMTLLQQEGEIVVYAVGEEMWVEATLKFVKTVEETPFVTYDFVKIGDMTLKATA